MASPNPGGTVYKREGASLREAWNGLVAHVNWARANPPSFLDCDELDVIPEVAEDHVWTVKDVTDMRTAIDAMCEYSWATDVVYWKDEILEEFETALLRDYSAWGDADECHIAKDCVPAWEHCGEGDAQGHVTICEIRFADESKFWYTGHSWSDCQTWPNEWQYAFVWSEVRAAAMQLGQEILDACLFYSAAFVYYFSYNYRLEWWEAWVAEQQTVVDEVSAQDPPSAWIEHEQEILDSLKERRDEIKEERDYWDTQAVHWGQLAESKADQQALLLSSLQYIEADMGENMWPMITACNGVYPWPTNPVEAYPYLSWTPWHNEVIPPQPGLGPSRCAVSWEFGHTMSLQAANVGCYKQSSERWIITNPDPDPELYTLLLAQGSTTPSGKLFATWLSDYLRPICSTFVYWCCPGPGSCWGHFDDCITIESHWYLRFSIPGPEESGKLCPPDWVATEC